MGSLTGNLNKNSIEINTERIEIEEEKIKQILKTEKRILKKQWNFNNSLVSYINRKNNIPIVLGIENNSHRILSNVIAELKLKCSEEDSLLIQNIGSNDEGYLYHRLDEFDLSKENESNIRKLFKDNLTQTSSKVWEFSSKPFTLLPNKIKVLDTVIILYPKNSIKIEFNISLFSENILQPIEKTCELSINLTKRELTKEEMEEIIEKLPEDDDLPF